MLIVLAALVMCCAFTDLLFGKIYNVVTLSAFAAGVFWRLQAAGTESLGALLYLAFVPMGILLPFWLIRQGKALGAGDIKLLGAVGMLCGRDAYWKIFALTFAAATLLAGGIWIAQRIRREQSSAQEIRVPMAVAVLAGTIAYYGGIR